MDGIEFPTGNVPTPNSGMMPAAMPSTLSLILAVVAAGMAYKYATKKAKWQQHALLFALVAGGGGLVLGSRLG